MNSKIKYSTINLLTSHVTETYALHPNRGEEPAQICSDPSNITQTSSDPGLYAGKVKGDVLPDELFSHSSVEKYEKHQGDREMRQPIRPRR